MISKSADRESPILRVRNGLPRLAARLRSGATARIVAFGSSITDDAYYLEPLAPRLRTAFPGADVDTIVRSLPGFMSFWAVHRTRFVSELNPDLAIIEFAVNDHGLQVPEITMRSIEGIVRKLRSVAEPPDIAFVYFMSRMVEALPRQGAVIEMWERVATHYGITSIDGSALAEQLVRDGQAIWLDRWPGRRSWVERNRPLALTRDFSHQTFAGGKMLGDYVARAIASAASGISGAGAALPAPLFADHYGDAQSYFPADLERNGWTRRLIDDSAGTHFAVMYFSELLTADGPGAALEFTFSGRELKIWAYSSPNNVIALDGNRAALDLPDPRMSYPSYILRGEESATHTIRIEATELPLEIGAIDSIGELTIESR